MEWEKIDEEWVALIIEAKNSGLSINDVREFLTDPNTILSIYR
nr:anti-repressor SinI family protein [Oceanobacillus limi]